ncbi:MAG: hypothetical protein KJ565_21310 [Gammaproteobacteria bacterium]|nr:hypothetical protein [Gammaproteobacteria bacterium]
MTILNGGNIGIGTTGPSRNLDVSGIIGVENAGVEKVYLYASPTGADVVFTGVGGNVRFDTRSGGISYINTGNVGIGTTSPGAYKLNVAGNTYISGDVKLGSTNAFYLGDSATSFGRSASQALLYGQEGVKLRYYDDGVPGVRDGLIVQSDGDIEIMNGNVGIGTTAPTAKLDVSGGDLALQTSQKIILDSNDTGDASNSYIVHDAANNRVCLYVDGIEMVRINK